MRFPSVVLTLQLTPDMGKPPFKASEGGRCEILYVIGGFHFW